jgi:hypothetical protein
MNLNTRQKNKISFSIEMLKCDLKFENGEQAFDLLTWKSFKANLKLNLHQKNKIGCSIEMLKFDLKFENGEQAFDLKKR